MNSLSIKYVNFVQNKQNAAKVKFKMSTFRFCSLFNTKLADLPQKG